MAQVDAEHADLARTYAAALLELARVENVLEVVEGDLDALGEVVRTDAAFAAFVASPVVTTEAKSESVGRIFSGRVNDLTLRFLRVLADHDRLDLLDAMADQYRAENDWRLGRIHVEVTTAVALEERQRESLRLTLGGQLGGEVILEQEVEPGLLGGLLIRIGDVLFDGSVRRRLDDLRRQIISRGSHEIQSGRDLVAD